MEIALKLAKKREENRVFQILTANVVLYCHLTLSPRIFLLGLAGINLRRFFPRAIPFTIFWINYELIKVHPCIIHQNEENGITILNIIIVRHFRTKLLDGWLSVASESEFESWSSSTTWLGVGGTSSSSELALSSYEVRSIINILIITITRKTFCYSSYAYFRRYTYKLCHSNGTNGRLKTYKFVSFNRVVLSIYCFI